MSNYLKDLPPLFKKKEPREMTPMDGVMVFVLAWTVLIGGYWLACRFVVPHLIK